MSALDTAGHDYDDPFSVENIGEVEPHDWGASELTPEDEAAIGRLRRSMGADDDPFDESSRYEDEFGEPRRAPDIAAVRRMLAWMNGARLAAVIP